MEAKRKKYSVVLPDGAIARRTSKNDYGWMVAGRSANGRWADRGWRSDLKAAESLKRAEEKRGGYEEVRVFRARVTF